MMKQILVLLILIFLNEEAITHLSLVTHLGIFPSPTVYIANQTSQHVIDIPIIQYNISI